VFVNLPSRLLAVCCVTWLLVGAAVPAVAQTPPVPASDLSLGYQTLHIPGQNYPLGVFVGASHGFTDILRIAGEAGLSIDQQSAPNLNGTLTAYQYGIGPRVQMASGRVLPYAQFLVGGVHSRADLTNTGAPSTANGWLLQPGAGVIVPVTRTFAFQGGVNYRHVIFRGNNDNETSVIAGVRIAFR
jgi:hypothetical protein